MVRVIFFLLPLLATAQSWSTVQALTPGTKIELHATPARLRGTLVSTTSDSLVLHNRRGDRSFPASEVREVKIRSLSRQLRRGFIGTAIGVGAGIALAFVTCHSCMNESNNRDFIRYGAQAGGFFGAGFTFPFAAYKSVYKAPKH